MAELLKGRGVRYLSAGTTMVVSGVLFGVGGYLLDSQLGTLPLLLVVGVLLGSVGGFIHLIRVAAPELLPFGKRDRKRETSASENTDRKGAPSQRPGSDHPQP